MDHPTDEQPDEQQRQMIIRIIAMLYSLAGLLDRAAFAPRPVRRFVIWVMQMGEKRFISYVFDEARDHGCKRLPAAMFEPRRKNGRAEALRLADCFRAMAWVLGAIHGHHPMTPPAGGWWVERFDLSSCSAKNAASAGGLGAVSSRLANFLRRAVTARARASPPIPDTS